MMKFWCDTGDRYCDNGDKDDMADTYFDHYADQAVKFVVTKFHHASRLTHTDKPVPASGGSHQSSSAGKSYQMPNSSTYSKAAAMWASASTLGFLVFAVTMLGLC